MKSIAVLFIVGSILSCVSAWSNLNCAAPRSPVNGLSFIFHDGSRVEYRCHPGFRMIGYSSANCDNSKWDNPPPLCIEIKKGAPAFKHDRHRDSYFVNGNEQTTSGPYQVQESRPLFNWNEKKAVYGDGPRRLPLINGIWPPQDEANKVLAIGPLTTPFPKTLVKEEIDIAELRQKQLEELKGQRQKNIKYKGKKRNDLKRRNRQKNGTRNAKPNSKATLLTIVETTDGPAISIAKVNKRRHYRYKLSKLDSQKRQKEFGVSFLSSRISRVTTGGIAPNISIRLFNRKNAEYRGMPLRALSYRELMLLSTYDTSCVEQVFNRTVPSRAPELRHAFVYRYETMREPPYVYMVAKYRCFSGFHLLDKDITMLYCKKRKWVGEPPLCLRNKN